MTLRNQILDLSRQNNIGELTPWFSDELDLQIQQGHFPAEEQLIDLSEDLVVRLEQYRLETGASTVVLGMSGGVDSALTAALFKRAGWTVIGVTMPIHQNPEETARGKEACDALGIEHRHIDLSMLYDHTLAQVGQLDRDLDRVEGVNDTRTKIRRGNVRARLRMVTLYNLASMEGGLVASTDNFSELAAGFWTLHGDVGDVSPIQSLLKSWEVPFISQYVGVPESTYRATPTDGLGISAGDEAQLGGSYLEWDLMVNAITNILADNRVISSETNVTQVRDALDLLYDERALQVFNSVMTRMGSTWFKRMNPVNLQNKIKDRYAALSEIDNRLFVPKSITESSTPVDQVSPALSAAVAAQI
jgi:nicotinamide-nucleotide amidase